MSPLLTGVGIGSIVINGSPILAPTLSSRPRATVAIIPLNIPNTSPRTRLVAERGSRAVKASRNFATPPTHRLFSHYLRTTGYLQTTVSVPNPRSPSRRSPGDGAPLHSLTLNIFTDAQTISIFALSCWQGKPKELSELTQCVWTPEFDNEDREVFCLAAAKIDHYRGMDRGNDQR